MPRETFFSRVFAPRSRISPAPLLASVGVVALAGVGSILVALVAAGAGGLIGAALGRMIHERHATRVQEQLERGGLVLWVNVRNAGEEEAALEVLRAHSARRCSRPRHRGLKIEFRLQRSPLAARLCGNVLLLDDPIIRGS